METAPGGHVDDAQTREPAPDPSTASRIVGLDPRNDVLGGRVMKTTHYDISVDVDDLIEDADSFVDSLVENPIIENSAIENSTIRDSLAGNEPTLTTADEPPTADTADTAVTTVTTNTDDSDDSNDTADTDDDNMAVSSLRARRAARGPLPQPVLNIIEDDTPDTDDDTPDTDDDNMSVSSLRARRAARGPLPPPVLNIIDEDDLDWVARLIDIVASCRGQPWRVALEHLDGAQYLDRPVPHQQFVAAVQALQRLLSRSHKAQLARACRELVLGHPALSQTTRTDRIAAAARALEISCDDVERLLWADLPRERPVELPLGRPSELEVAAFANVQLIQRAVRRAQTITIAVRGDAGPLIRGASTRGLLATVRVARPDDRPVDVTTSGRADHASRTDNNASGIAADNTSRIAAHASRIDDITILDIVGPLTLCHRTAVYGRALASLVPLLAECSAFELTLSATGITGPYRSRLASPVLLPSLPAKATIASATASRLARELRRGDPSLEIDVGPPPMLVGETFVCPDIAIDRGRLYVEIIGFWTAPYLERKRSAYRRAGIEVVLCVDESRGCADEQLPENVMGFTRFVDAQAILRRFGEVIGRSASSRSR